MIDNVDSTHTGIGNKLGKGILAYSGFLKSIKKKNRRLYYLGKWTVTLAVLALLVAWLV